MMTRERKRYLRHFRTEQIAWDRMVTHNRAAQRARNREDCYCVIEGPDDKWTVCDLETAIEIGLPYEWSYRY